MLAPIERIARFIAGGADDVSSAFAGADVTILENFAPHLFTGPDAVARWAAQMRKHAAGLSGMRHAFGAAQDFAPDGDRVFFSLPTHWQGFSHGRAFAEDGGWAFVLVRQDGEWRVRNYAWAVTRIAAG
jgi:hypothetical protein